MSARPKFRNASRLAVMLGCFVIATSVVSAATSPARTPPPESTSKVKRVLLYNKIGGWVANTGIENLKQYLVSMTQAKGFTLDSLNDETSLTLEYLKQYQVIIWNNNTNGAVSVPSLSARMAIVDYVHQGGGWFLIGLAGDHQNTWTDLGDMLGARISRWPAPGTATMQVDSSALIHPELRHVVSSLPPAIVFKDTWVVFTNSVRALRGVTVLYTAHGPKSVVYPNDDGSGGPDYVWARSIGKGKLLYSPVGWAPVQPSVFVQADSAISKLYWNSMRWLAGDFQNGCADPTSPQFNPEARVDDGSCFPNKVRIEKRAGGQADKRQIRHSFAPLIPEAEGFQNHDIRGKRIYNFQVGLPKLVEE